MLRATVVLCVSPTARRFIWNFFRLEAEHLSNVGEFRAVRDISLQPIKLLPKDEAEEEGDILSALPSVPQVSQQVVPTSSNSNSHSASIKSLAVNRSPNAQSPMVTSSCSVMIENPPTEMLTAAANQLELTIASEEASRREVKNSTKTLNKAADEIELIATNQHDVEADLQLTTDSTL